MLVRVRTRDGNHRFPVEGTDDISLLIERLLQASPDADPSTLTFSNQPRGGENKADDLKGNSLNDLGIAHGHLLYADFQLKAPAKSESHGDAIYAQNGGGDGATSSAAAQTSIALPSNGATSTVVKAGSSSASKAERKPWQDAKQDEVDIYWQAKDGKIPRPKDTKFCRHGDKAMCDYCMPLEPYDAAYHTEHQIKHLSFNAHLRKKDIATNKPSQSYIPPLEPEDYRVKVPCPSGTHPSWPSGICTKCQPSAITLQRQPYRMVDHVEFSHPQLIENLLAFWRSSGVQRFGFLLGRYQPYEKVPMGVKAVVEAISEPPQEGEVDGLTLGVPWEDQARVEKLAKDCGLSIVGMIYSDLLPADPTLTDPSKAGMVACKRHKDSFFLSGCEVLFSAALQSSNLSPSRYSNTGYFNSKFVTCVLSGTEEGAIDVSAYQVSEQAMAMVQSEMIEASVNPNIIRVKQSKGSVYVPEVFYRYTNEYKIDVKESAKPTFPVEYLLVNVTHGFPNEPKPLFLSSKFPIENRQGLHDQDLGRACSSLAAVLGNEEMLPLAVIGEGLKGKERDEDLRRREKLVGVLSDWHLVAFLETCGILGTDDMSALCKVATVHDATSALDGLLQQTGWQTLAAIAREHAPQPSSAAGGAEVRGVEGGGGTIGGMFGGGSSSGAASGSTNRSTRPAAGASSAPSRTTPNTRGTGSAADPLIYNGDSEEEDFDFNEYADEDVGDGDQDEDQEMLYDDEEDEFEDARSAESGSAGVAAEHGAGAGSGGARRNPTSWGNATTTRQAAAPQASEPEPAGKACPHCTFVNEKSSGDCDVCGLPL
ncbi:putative NPL4-nuclear protein localization factor and ER translocation component [Ceraceosorus guamensis]|uniref:Nuclear protein localization protein 4 n=1 Tax=Ceraceosorus guamensis TaxID=1522189 RepID=A0A316VSC1_9BASI|nr:putative NPL4-nuclear protein localization factor and ER translocation component [Ceraceosorus guamensis]PWN40260.1 putative NPL4-nuclear protein localization factor and ER translocation component [Ceraceosorus guamensis]